MVYQQPLCKMIWFFIQYKGLSISNPHSKLILFEFSITKVDKLYSNITILERTSPTEIQCHSNHMIWTNIS